MIKVITYGTFDLFHKGHELLLKRAKALGDYLIVGVTSDDYDKFRGKIYVQNSLVERMSAIESTGLADKIIVEEYEGQKIDDIRRYGVDIFTVGSDWNGCFDYLNEFCKVIYLPRTDGISSSELRSDFRQVKIGIKGSSNINVVEKFINESKFVNGVIIEYICLTQLTNDDCIHPDISYTTNYDEMLSKVDAVYVISSPESHYNDTKIALNALKHVLCESPIATNRQQCIELFSLAKQNNLILMDGIKTAYSQAYERLVLMVKGGKIGDVVSVDSVCTSLKDPLEIDSPLFNNWNSISTWAPLALLPVFQIFGTSYSNKLIYSKFLDKDKNIDIFTKIDFAYKTGVASIKVAKGSKSEGCLIISGTRGYVYVPAPWWKTDYFEIRYENFTENQRFFYQLEGEGIRYEIVAFVKAIESGINLSYVSQNISLSIASIIDDFDKRVEMVEID